MLQRVPRADAPRRLGLSQSHLWQHKLLLSPKYLGSCNQMLDFRMLFYLLLLDLGAGGWSLRASTQ